MDHSKRKAMPFCIVCNDVCSPELWSRHKHARNQLFCTMMCCNADSSGRPCQYGDRCQFAHSNEELRLKGAGRKQKAVLWVGKKCAAAPNADFKQKKTQQISNQPIPNEECVRHHPSAALPGSCESATKAPRNDLRAFPPGLRCVGQVARAPQTLAAAAALESVLCKEFAESVLRVAICD